MLLTRLLFPTMAPDCWSFPSSSIYVISDEEYLLIMANQSNSLDLCSQDDTITPSSSISQVFTNNQTDVDNCSFYSLTPDLDFVRLSKGRKIIQYPSDRTKIPVFQEWWDATTWAQKRREAKKPSVQFSRGKSSSVWNEFHEGAEFPDGTPCVFCVSCAHLLQHPSIENYGTSSMRYHVRKGCRKKSSSVISKRTVAQMLSEKPVEWSLL